MQSSTVTQVASQKAPVHKTPNILLASNPDRSIMSVLKHPAKVSPSSSQTHNPHLETISLPSSPIEEVSTIVPKIISEVLIVTVPETPPVRLATRDGDNNLQDNSALIPVSYSPDAHTIKPVIDIKNLAGVVTEQEYKHTLVSTIQ